MRIILASASPRRSQLLSTIFHGEIIVDPPNIDENKISAIDNYDYPSSIALAKLQESIKHHKDETIIAADTMVLFNNVRLGKPHTYEEAFKMLKELQNNIHEVITGYCIYHNKKIYQGKSLSKVKIFEMSDEEIKEYINTKSPFDKAGGYGIQDLLIKAEVIEGSFFNVMGFPIEDIHELLNELYISL